MSFITITHRLNLLNSNIEDLLLDLKRPLSVILQITRNCHFNCDFFSEKDEISDFSLDELRAYEKNLKLALRIFLFGGELLTRKDFGKAARQQHLLFERNMI